MDKKGEYETFDSSGGPTNADNKDSAHRDSDLSAEGESAEHGDVPEVPQRKR